MITLTIPQIEKAIGIPSSEWKGKCHEIASKMVQANIVTGRAVYGHYLGRVAKTSFFASRRKLPFIAHGWIVTPDKKIIDPTRWVFEDVEPYIFVAEPKSYTAIKEYDEGGNQWREMTMTDPPPSDPDGKPVDLSGLKPPVLIHVKHLLGHVDPITIHHVFWLSNLSPRIIGEQYVADIYEWIIGMGHGMFIPIDNQRKYCGSKNLAVF